MAINHFAKNILNEHFPEHHDFYLPQDLLLICIEYNIGLVNNKEEVYTTINGKRYGLYKRWYDDPNKKLCKYDKFFEEKTYVHNQLLEEKTYVYDKKHGIYKKWYKNGQLWETKTYVDDE